MSVKMLCLDCDGGHVDFHSENYEFVLKSNIKSTCDNCGAPWTLRELLTDRDENCADCGYPNDKHPNPYCSEFKAKILNEKNSL